MPSSNHLQKALNAISKVSYFSNLDESSQIEIARHTSRKEYESGEAIFWEGDDSRGLYIVEDGWLKVVKLSSGGREQVLNFLGPGEMFNALSVFNGSPNPATCVALEPSTIWLVRRETMLRLLEEQPQMARLVIQDLADRLLHMLSIVEDLSLRTVEARLARLLLEQSSGESINRRRWATQTEMAARLGTVSDVLNRALRKLADEGLIEVARHQIKILDAEGLAVKAESTQ